MVFHRTDHRINRRACERAGACSLNFLVGEEDANANVELASSLGLFGVPCRKAEGGIGVAGLLLDALGCILRAAHT